MRKLPNLSVTIPADWTPEQALAVLQLLTDLRATLLARHNAAIFDYLEEQQNQSDDTDISDDLPDDWEPTF